MLNLTQRAILKHCIKFYTWQNHVVCIKMSGKITAHQLMQHLCKWSSSVVQWLRQETCTQWTWAQLPLIPIWVIGDGRTSLLVSHPAKIAQVKLLFGRHNQSLWATESTTLNSDRRVAGNGYTSQRWCLVHKVKILKLQWHFIICSWNSLYKVATVITGNSMRDKKRHPFIYTNRADVF